MTVILKHKNCSQLPFAVIRVERNSDLYYLKSKYFILVTTVILTIGASARMKHHSEGDVVEELKTTSLPFWLIRLKGLFTLATKFKPVSFSDTEASSPNRH